MSTSVISKGASSCGESLRRVFGDVEVVRLRSAGQSVRSLPGAELGPASFLLLYSLSGSDLVCVTDKKKVVLEPGDCSMVRNGQVIASGTGIDLIAVSIPDSSVGVHYRTLEGAVGHVYSSGQGTPSLVASLLTGLAGQLDHYAPSNPSRLAHHLVGLLTLMCADDVSSAKRQLLERSEEYIESHLSDVYLTPDRIADALHVSARTLHRVFEAEGITVGTWIRNRRLEQCRLDLTDLVLREVPVSVIASRWGLWDPSHFSRLFKSCFGLSPRAYRLAQSAAVADSGRRPVLSETA